MISGAISNETSDPMKARLKRIVAMLTRLAMRSDRVSESPPCYDSPVIVTSTSTSTASLSTSTASLSTSTASLSTSDGRVNSRRPLNRSVRA